MKMHRAVLVIYHTGDDARPRTIDGWVWRDDTYRQMAFSARTNHPDYEVRDGDTLVIASPHLGNPVVLESGITHTATHTHKINFLHESLPRRWRRRAA